MDNGRMAGLIDWDAIEDRGRNLERVTTWSDPKSILRAVADQYMLDPWRRQPYYVEVWIEKEALISVISGICDEWRVPHFACKGYASQSEVWGAGHGRFRSAIARDKTPVVIHLGDHDPSGIDMTRDIEERLCLFAEGQVEVRRLALNMDQVEEHQPPPNPAKSTDARFRSYYEEFGDESWELDALEPQVIADLIGDEIQGMIESDSWRASRSTSAPCGS